MDLYHVTFASNVSRILHSGIRIGKSPTWYKNGTGLFPRGFIFAFTDCGEAAKWAFRQSLHTSRNTVIMTFTSAPGNWIDDEHPEDIPDCLGRWIKSDTAVLSRDILGIICQAQWMNQIDEEHNSLPPREKMTVWKWFHTHLSAISQFLIINDHDGKK